MSKKHFEALAKALKAMCPYDELSRSRDSQWRGDVEAITEVCASFNVNFDRARFLKACGVEV